MNHVSSAKSRRGFKIAAASFGAAGALAMAVVGLGAAQGLAEPDDTGTLPPEPAITTGETITETTAPTSPETSVATPSVSATTPSGFAEPH
ncbi:hypothetical protein KZ782_24210 [Mycolicibacterium smegmatis]|nr:hypothetical protein KZ782_24210 [Mycolicibacterium smegmatis]